MQVQNPQNHPVILTTADYLEILKRHFNVDTDYKLAKKMGTAPGVISNYRLGKTRFDDFMCAQVADILGVPVIKVIAHIQLERDKREEAQEYWRKIAANVSGVATQVFAVVMLAGPLLVSVMQAAEQCILCKIKEISTIDRKRSNKDSDPKPPPRPDRWRWWRYVFPVSELHPHLAAG